MSGKDITDNSEKPSNLESALYKRAIGYDLTETVEEYALTDGECKLAKKKVTIKSVPPDIDALKILLNQTGTPIENMTDEELKKEREKLLKSIAEEGLNEKEKDEKQGD